MPCIDQLTSCSPLCPCVFLCNCGEGERALLNYTYHLHLFCVKSDQLLYPQLSETNTPGQFKLWALVGNDLHLIKLLIPRIFYVNQRSPKEERESDGVWKKVFKLLPRSYPAQHLYEYTIPEEVFRKHNNELMADLSSPDIEGIYETQVKLALLFSVHRECSC